MSEYFCWGCGREETGKTGYFCCVECWERFIRDHPGFFALKLLQKERDVPAAEVQRDPPL